MIIRSETVTGKTLKELTTEIMFFVASSKALKNEIFVLDIKPTPSEESNLRRAELVARVLKDLKRRGMIQFFAASSDFDSTLTEIEYLKNKYPNIIEIKHDGIFFAVKL